MSDNIESHLLSPTKTKHAFCHSFIVKYVFLACQRLITEKRLLTNIFRHAICVKVIEAEWRDSFVPPLIHQQR